MAACGVMDADTDGVLFRSELYPFVVGNSISIKKDFLEGARYMDAPEIQELIFEVTGTVGAVTSGAAGADAAKLFENIRISDDQEIVNASGAMLAINEKAELGERVVDPTDISSGATSTTYSYLLRIPFELPKAQRPRDTRLELDRMLAGGECQVTLCSSVPTGYNPASFAAATTTTYVRMYALVTDGRVRELKSRLTLREQAVTNQDYEYDVNGSLRAAYLGSKLTTTGYSSWASFTNVFSRTLKFQPSLRTALLVDRYRRSFLLSPAAADQLVASTPGAIPFHVPNQGQKIGEQPMIKTLHIDLTPSGQSAAPTAARLLTSQIRDRSPNMAALVAGQPSPEALARVLAERGRVVDGKPGGSPITEWPPELSRKLPVRIAA